MSTPDLHTGTVEWFDVERDLGLASCDDGSLPCTVHGRSARASGVPTLAVGDRVVTSAQFLIDSEARLAASLGAMQSMPGMDMSDTP